MAEEHNQSKKLFVFGYGTLMNSISRNSTVHTSSTYWIKLHSFFKSWCVHDPRRNHTALGIKEKKGAWCNGSLFQVSQKYMDSLDDRENGYRKIEINPSFIEFYDQDIDLKNSKIVAYQAIVHDQPNREFPIAQTYLDIVLSGCLEHSFHTAVDFLNNTKNWNKNWVNDRKQPRFKRNLTFDHDFEKLDLLIQDHSPNLLKLRENG